MPLKLIGMILIMLVVVCFAGFNVNYKSNISFIFHEFKDVPVFVTMFCAFCAGVLFTLPFTLGRDSARRKVREAKNEIAQLKAENAKFNKSAKLPKKKHGKKHARTAESSPAAIVPAEASAAENPEIQL